MSSDRRPSPSELPKALAIETRGPLDAVVRVPGSKSITNRVLLIAALADGESRISGGLASDDTEVMCTSLSALGIEVDTTEQPWRIVGRGGRLTPPTAPLYIGNSGTSARFLTASATLAEGAVEIDGNARMRERPIADLVAALERLGASIDILGQQGCPPLRIHGGGLPGGLVRIDARRSSQYVSAILLAAPYAADSITLNFIEEVVVSRPYIDLTLEIMRDFGAQARWLGGADERTGDPEVDRRDEPGLYVRAGQPYTAREYTVEPDASSAAYPFCAAAIAGGRVRVEGLPERSSQADLALLDLLERMGCSVSRDASGIELRGPDNGLRSLGEVDMNDLPDAALAYAVVALFADGPTLIKNVATLRIKETDRLGALETELRKLGARASANADSLSIAPGPLRGAPIDTYDDHRMAMAFSLAGLRVPGVVIKDPRCVAKTWPGYFDVFQSL